MWPRANIFLSTRVRAGCTPAVFLDGTKVVMTGITVDDLVRPAEIEGIEYRFLTSQTEVLYENNKVVGLKCIRNRLGDPDASGRRAPVPIPGTGG